MKAAGANYRQSYAQWESFTTFVAHRNFQGMTHK